MDQATWPHGEQTAIDRLLAWGFNTLGNWSDPRLTASRSMPYVLPIYLWGDYAQIGDGSNVHNNMPDVFDPKFGAVVDLLVKKAVSTHKEDPYLIGYFVDNELPWGIGDSTNPRLRYALAVNTLRLGAESPAKQSFVRLLAEKYVRTEALDFSLGHRHSLMGSVTSRSPDIARLGAGKGCVER